MSESWSVLIIDDSEVLLTRLKQRLVAEGYEVFTTTQTVGAARFLLRCEMVIIDFHMPGIDGGSVVASLRAACRERAPLFYLYSSDAAATAKYRDLGFDGALTHKGDDDSLVKQLSAARRMAKLKSISERKP